MKTRIYYLTILLTLMFISSGYSQERIDILEQKLDVLSLEIPALQHEIDLSVSKVPIQEFIRSMANLTELNVSVSPEINVAVTNNFNDIPIKDVLLFLCREYNLDLHFTGRIISVENYLHPPEPYIRHPLKISFNKKDSTINLDLKNDSLLLVTREITQQSNINVVCPPELEGKLISFFVQEVNLYTALENLAIANKLDISEKDDVFLFIETAEYAKNNQQQNRNRDNYQQAGSEFVYNVRDKNKIDVYAVEMPIKQVVSEISKQLEESYFLFSDLTGTVNLNLEKASFETFLKKILNGSAYAFTKQNDIYLIGNRLQEGLRETKVINLHYRSIKDLTNIIPESLKKDISIVEFVDLNSFVLSGSAAAIVELETFLYSIDKTVPMVLIEVIIIDNQTGYQINTGIQAGISDEPVKSGGKLYPGIDYTFNSESVNKLLNSFSGFGFVNMGKVSPNFYLTIQAMEEAGLIKVRSTPKLSTLNGHEATISIGNTEYYVEERTDFIINQSTSQKTTEIYQSVTAEFKLIIQPIVSGNNQITMNVQVDQSDFTGRISKQAPPGQVSRSFSSLIRVDNEEMVLLGGLEEKTIKNTGTGWPLLSRIPILKWLFSSQSREKQDNKLNIFIKPTVIL